MTPLATSATAPVSALPTVPVPFSAVVSVSLTVAVTAFMISPVPLIVPTIVPFTRSPNAGIEASCCIGNGHSNDDWRLIKQASCRRVQTSGVGLLDRMPARRSHA